MAPTPVFLPGESHGQRTLAGYSAWGHAESDMTETKHTYIFIVPQIWKQPNIQPLNWISWYFLVRNATQQFKRRKAFHARIWWTSMHYAKWRKSDSKATYYMIPFTWCSGKGKTATAEKRSEVFQDLEVRGRTDYKGTTQGNFEGVTVLNLEFCICQN